MRAPVLAITDPQEGGTRSQIMRTLSDIESAARGEDDSPVVALARLKERFGTIGILKRTSEAKAEADAKNEFFWLWLGCEAMRVTRRKSD